MARTGITIESSLAKASKRSYVVPALFVSVFLCLCAVGVAGYFYYQYKHVAAGPANETVEITKLTDEIGSVMILPQDEVPTLATVTDTEKLADQPFFQKAQNGDKVLIYTNTGRAILYRPSTKPNEKGRIVDVTTINVNTPTPTKEASTPAEATPAPTEATPAVPVTDAVPALTDTPAKIALYNGTTKKGLTQKYETAILKTYPAALIPVKESALKSDYMKTVVVDVTGKQTALAQKLAMAYGVTVTTIPTGEVVPDTDVLIIYGTDQL